MDIIQQLTTQFGLQRWQVENTVKLIDEGNTIPFIARYRKEAHGTLDDQVIRELSEKLEYLRNLEKRREEVRSLIEAQEKLTEEISLDKNIKHNIDIIVDRLVVKDGIQRRLADSIETTLKLAEGTMTVDVIGGEPMNFSESFSCKDSLR